MRALLVQGEPGNMFGKSDQAANARKVPRTREFTYCKIEHFGSTITSYSELKEIGRKCMRLPKIGSTFMPFEESVSATNRGISLHSPVARRPQLPVQSGNGKVQK
jgi:hypothetical protein